MSTATKTTGKATLVRTMDPTTWKGDSRLYKLDPPLFGNVEHAVVSSLEDAPPMDPILALLGSMAGLKVPTGGPETMLIPTDAEGDDRSEEGLALNDEHSHELLDLVSNTTDHVQFLADLDYEVAVA